jgi:ABC-type phosphate/phosphonate transport system substrate-binding protein
MMVAAASGYFGSARGKPPASASNTLSVGIPKSIFQRIPEAVQSIATEPFVKYIKDHTGIEGKLHVLRDSAKLGRQLDEDEIQAGIFQGFEFAWAQADYPDLVPLVICTPPEPCQAFCLVRADCAAKTIGDLKGQKMSLPPMYDDQCPLFLTHLKTQFMKGGDFSEVIKEKSGVDAIFDVIDKKSACTTVDRLTLEYFESAYPGPYKNLRVLCESGIFPDACIAIKKGSLSPEVVEKLRSTLLDARNQPAGRELLTLWKMKSFDKVSANYLESLKRILKKYPAKDSSVTRR